MRCALGAVIWLILELEKKNLNKLHQQKRDIVIKAMSRQQSATQWYPSPFWRNWHKWHMTDHCLLKSGAAGSPKHCCLRSPTQYVQVVGTEQALIAVGDSIGTADGAEDLGADQHLFAFLICSVRIRTAVHLSKEGTATGWRRHFTFTTLILHETVNRYNLQWGFHYHSTNWCWWGNLVTGEPFLQEPPHTAGEEERAKAMRPPDGVNQWWSLMLTWHRFTKAEHWYLILTFLWPLQCTSVITLSFSTH